MYTKNYNTHTYFVPIYIIYNNDIFVIYRSLVYTQDNIRIKYYIYFLNLKTHIQVHILLLHIQKKKINLFKL